MRTNKRLLLIPAILLTLLLAASPVAAQQWTLFTNTRISIVWPQDGQGHPTNVAQSRAVNASIWPHWESLCAAESAGIQLLMAKDNEPTTPVGGGGQIIVRNVAGVTFSSAEFNDIPANLAAEPTAKYRFVTFGWISNSIQGFSGNVWVHAVDPRTFYPAPVVPVGYGSNPVPPQGMDARIQIVWPHDEQGTFAPVERATRVNIAVDIFEHGTLKAVPSDQSGHYLVSPGILMAEQNDSLHGVFSSKLEQVTYTVNGQTFPRWVFNDIAVQPGRQYHFVVWATANFNTTRYPYAIIWTHAPDARTFLPVPQVPPPCVPSNR